jgi:hypothetical protein
MHACSRLQPCVCTAVLQKRHTGLIGLPCATVHVLINMQHECAGACLHAPESIWNRERKCMTAGCHAVVLCTCACTHMDALTLQHIARCGCAMKHGLPCMLRGCIMCASRQLLHQRLSVDWTCNYAGCIKYVTNLAAFHGMCSITHLAREPEPSERTAWWHHLLMPGSLLSSGILLCRPTAGPYLLRLHPCLAAFDPTS